MIGKKKKGRPVSREFRVAEGALKEMRKANGGCISVEMADCKNLEGCSLTIVVTDGPFKDYYKHVDG